MAAGQAKVAGCTVLGTGLDWFHWTVSRTLHIVAHMQQRWLGAVQLLLLGMQAQAAAARATADTCACATLAMCIVTLTLPNHCVATAGEFSVTGDKQARLRRQ